ncbi:MAG: hypothetical protein R3C18_14680 [Planctomycetaceae bacterium]
MMPIERFVFAFAIVAFLGHAPTMADPPPDSSEQSFYGPNSVKLDPEVPELTFGIRDSQVSSEDELKAVVEEWQYEKAVRLAGPYVTDDVVRTLEKMAPSIVSLQIRGGNIPNWAPPHRVHFDGRGLKDLKFSSLMEFNFGFQYVDTFGAARWDERLVAGVMMSDPSQFSEDGMAALATAPKLETVSLVDCLIRDHYLLHLADSTHLKNLQLAGNPLSGEGLAHLRGCRELEQLCLHGCALTDEGLQKIPPLPNLITLDVSNNQITDAALREISRERFPKLRQLILDRTDVTAAGLVQLKGIGPMLSIGELRLRDEDLMFLDELSEVRALSLFRNPITDASVVRLSRLKQLEYLDVRQTKITQAGLDKLQSSLPECVLFKLLGPVTPPVYPGGRDAYPGMDATPNSSE